MEMEEKKNMNTTKDMFKMALAVEYMKAVVSDATWIPQVCAAHNVVDGWHIQSKTVVCQRGVIALHAVEAGQKSAQRISAAILHGLFAEKKQSSILTGNTPVPNPDPGRRMRMKSRNNRTQRSLGPSRTSAQPVCQSFIRIK